MDIKNFRRYTINVDGEVFDKKKGYFIKPRIIGGYKKLNLRDDNNIVKTTSIHRLIALHFIDNPNNYPWVDHIDQNKLNNNINNLRWCTKSQNGMNKKIFITNKSGWKGIHKNKNKFRVQITYENIKYNIGNYDDPISAAYSYNVAAKLLFKNFACLNLIDSPENYLQLKYLVFYRLSKHFDNIDHLVEKYKQFI